MKKPKYLGGRCRTQTTRRELTTFRRKWPNRVFEAWREGQHDDRVLAAAIAVWEA